MVTCLDRGASSYGFDQLFGAAASAGGRWPRLWNARQCRHGASSEERTRCNQAYLAGNASGSSQ